MRLLVDTNILLYLVNEDAAEHKKIRRFMNKLVESGTPWCLT